MHRPARTWLLAAALTSLACATAESTRRAELRRRLDEVRLSRSPAEVWPEVQRFLHERGYPLVGDDRLAVGARAQSGLGKLFSQGFQTRVGEDGSRVLETDPEGDSRARVRVEARALEDGGTRLRMALLKRSEVNPVEQTELRDADMELALLERLDPAAAARVVGRQPAAAAPGAEAAPADGWAAARPLVGSWSGRLPDGTAVRWRFEFAAEGQYLELQGTPLLFAGPAARARGGDELGRLARAAAGDRLVWIQFTRGGRVDRWESSPNSTATSTPTSASTPTATLVFVSAPESLPAGSRARLTLRRAADELVATLELAATGGDLAPAGEVRLARAR